METLARHTEMLTTLSDKCLCQCITNESKLKCATINKHLMSVMFVLKDSDDDFANGKYK